jgi:MFS transporter, putative metabolite:H+ symporter
LSAYHRRLFFFLSVASFFEGYDFLALSQVLPNLRAAFGLDAATGGSIVSLIGVGTVLAYAVVRQADRWGRRRVLMLAILGYAVFTFLTGLSRGVYDFTLFQLAARIFLIAQWALCMVYAAEEFPAERRGLALGVVQGASVLGSVVCAAAAPLLLQTAYGWRSLYFVGVAPLLLVAYGMRGIRESERFVLHVTGQHPVVTAPPPRGLTEILHSPYRRRVLQLALIWALTYMCTQTAIVFWKEFAVNERGFTDAQVGTIVTIAAVVSLPPAFAAGKLLDVIGRRPSAVVIYLLTAAGTLVGYQAHSYWLLTAAMTVAIFGGVALLTLLNAFTTELFPTDRRADAFAWSNNLLGRLGYVVAPAVVGAAAGVIGWGNAVSLTAVFPLVALALVLWLLPETKQRELEETAAL